MLHAVTAAHGQFMLYILQTEMILISDSQCCISIVLSVSPTISRSRFESNYDGLVAPAEEFLQDS